MASGTIRDRILKQRNEARQEAHRLRTTVLDLLGEEWSELLDDYVAAEVAVVEWTDVWRHYDKND